VLDTAGGTDIFHMPAGPREADRGHGCRALPPLLQPGLPLVR
jgi:hypothetical protein